MCAGVCESSCDSFGLGENLTKAQKLALLERQEKIVKADLEMIQKMKESVSSSKEAK